MPQYLGDIELELDITETHDGGRVPQEMARSGPAGEPNRLQPGPLNPHQLEAKMLKTKRRVRAGITQVRRWGSPEREGG
jgi:hypothetical protein